MQAVRMLRGILLVYSRQARNYFHPTTGNSHPALGKGQACPQGLGQR